MIWQAVAKFNIGVVHYYTGEVELAIENYLLSEEIYHQIDDQTNLSRVYNDLGLIYRQTKNYTLAIDVYEKSLLIKRALSNVKGIKNFQTPCVFLTSYYDDHTLNRAQATDPYGYIVKPFDEGNLLANVKLSVIAEADKFFVRDRGRILAPGPWL